MSVSRLERWRFFGGRSKKKGKKGKGGDSDDDDVPAPGAAASPGAHKNRGKSVSKPGDAGPKHKQTNVTHGLQARNASVRLLQFLAIT